MLTLIRDIFTTKFTTSALYLDDKPLIINDKQIYFCEDVARPDGVKIDKETAVPGGMYFLTITFSNRFQEMLPLIYNVADLSVMSGSKRWDGIRQHKGNTEADTEGCQLMGLIRNSTGVASSRDAYDIYLPWIKKFVADNGGKIPYRIVNLQP